MAASAAAAAAPARLVACLCEHTEPVWGAAWSPGRRLLATCSGDRTVRVWAPQSLTKWDCVAVLDEFVTRTVRQVAWSPSGDLLAATSFDGDTAVWKCEGGAPCSSAANDRGDVRFEALATLKGHENEVKGVAWSQDGVHLATSGRDKNVWVWEMTSEGDFECLEVLSGHSQDVKAVRWVPSPSTGALRVVSCSYDNTCRLWEEDPDSGDWTCSQVLEGHAGTVWDIAVSDDGSRIWSAGADGRILCWVCEGGKDFRLDRTVESGHAEEVLHIDWSEPLGLLLTAGTDGSFRVLQAGAEVHSEGGAHDGEVNAAVWSPFLVDGHRVIASVGDDACVRLWSWERAATD
jgi:cytosolic iron-sulfur protein assembly protein CIAO1